MADPIPFEIKGTYVESADPGGRRVRREASIEVSRAAITEEEKYTVMGMVFEKMRLREGYLRVSSNYIFAPDWLSVTAKTVDEQVFWNE